MSNFLFQQGDNPLHLAVSGGNFEMTKMLLERKDIDPNIKNKSGNTPLHLSIIHKHIEIAQMLLERKDVDPNGKNGGCSAKASKRKTKSIRKFSTWHDRDIRTRRCVKKHNRAKRTGTTMPHMVCVINAGEIISQVVAGFAIAPAHLNAIFHNIIVFQTFCFIYAIACG
ncbi:Hypothetical predicted protein [Mytilus galloprovincialis]|uniref:Uncharacterized protein n=1 Tax=Mytilus galloprovincialis TaxID=29158 RepID=A0A8B6BY31_MYTGA|nr:Hypothetical predicted protein [Mytilus galloprovincialis]